jgi:hypothetical protein
MELDGLATCIVEGANPAALVSWRGSSGVYRETAYPRIESLSIFAKARLDLDGAAVECRASTYTWKAV